jgi:hypothetical protein
MTSPHLSHTITRAATVTVLVALSTVVVVAYRPGTAAAATPTVTITPGPSSGAFTNGQTVTVSVGPNSLFIPHSRVNLIECADPGGSEGNLPTSLTTCDANTVEADTVLVQPDGSFVEHGYTLYALPNEVLGEQSNWQPVCNPTNQCVLYVGEDQNDFTQPKTFSAPFAFTTAATAIVVGGTTTTTTTATSTTKSQPQVSSSVSLAPTTLAFTGASPAVLWLAISGVSLVGAGLLARRILRRWSR